MRDIEVSIRNPGELGIKTWIATLGHLIQVSRPETSDRDPAPGIFGTEPCKLIAVSRNDLEKEEGIRYAKGFPDTPIKTPAEDIITHIGPEVT